MPRMHDVCQNSMPFSFVGTKFLLFLFKPTQKVASIANIANISVVFNCAWDTWKKANNTTCLSVLGRQLVPMHLTKSNRFLQDWLGCTSGLQLLESHEICARASFFVMSRCQTQIGLQASIFHVEMHFSNLRSMQFKEWDWSLSVSCRLLLLWFASCNWCCNRNNVVVLRPRSGKQNIMKWFLNMKQDSNFFKQMMDFGCHLVGGFFALQVLSIQKMEICILACVFLGLLHGSLVWATKNSVEQTWPWNLLIC